MSMFYVRPHGPKEKRTWIVYDDNGEIIWEEPTRAAALVCISETSDPDAAMCVTSVGNIFTVETHRRDYESQNE